MCFIVAEDTENCDNGKVLGKLFVDGYQQNCQNENITFVVNYPFKEELSNEDNLREYFGFVISDSQYRSSHRRCSVRKGVLRNFVKFTGKHLC